MCDILHLHEIENVSPLKFHFIDSLRDSLSLHFSFVIEICSTTMTAYNLFCFGSILFSVFRISWEYIPWLWYKSFHAHIQIGSQCFGLKSNLAFSWEIWRATKKKRAKRETERGRTESSTKMSMPIFGLLYREHMHTHLKKTRNDAVIILRFTKHFPSVVKNRSLVSSRLVSSLHHRWIHCIFTVYIQPMGLDVHQS